MSLQRFRTNKQRPNYFLAFIVFALCLFGLLMIYSASVVISYQNFGYNYNFLNRQAIALFIGIIAWFIMLKVDYRFWQKYAFWLFAGTLFLLILVYIPGIGLELGGAKRWISLGPITIQPSEIAKLTFIIYLAAWLTKKGEDVRNIFKGFIPFAIVLAFIALTIIKQPDMGTAVILVAIATIMFFISGASVYHLLLGGTSLAFLFFVFVKTSTYRMQRLMVFLNPEEKSLGAAYHINQALLAIGSGGLWGLGFGQSKQKYLYLPETHIDSIYAIIVEELGFLRSGLVVIAFLIIGVIGYKIAKGAPDMFGKLLATGITTWIVFQGFLNIATMLGMVPLTGVPLPFISFGGNSLVLLLAAVGILMNISKQCQD